MNTPNEQKSKIKKSIPQRIKSFFTLMKNIGKEIVFFFRFIILLFFVFVKYLINLSPKRKLDKPKKTFLDLSFIKRMYDRVYVRVLKMFDTKDQQEVKSSDLILLAMKNLSSKKNRTFVTIGGMAIGFGAVILLLSAGYGFERLVISQVASLSEMKQIDVSISQGSPLTFNSEVISNMSEIKGVNSVIPIITSVSKVTYNNAVSDVIVYGVNSKYLSEAGISPLKGELFTDEIVNLQSKSETDKKETGVVAGASSVLISKKSLGEEVYKVRYSINPVVWKPVYSQASADSKVIGYTKREVGKQEAIEVWGQKYRGAGGNSAIDVEGREYSTWIKDEFPLWEKVNCSMTDPDCIESKYLVLRDLNSQVKEVGFTTEEDLVIERYQLSFGSALELYEGKIIDDISFNIKDGDYTDMYLDPKADAIMIPVKNNGLLSQFDGQLMYGDFYEDSEGFFVKSDNGGNLGYWIKSTISLYASEECKSVCEVYSTLPQNESDRVVPLTVYFKASDINMSEDIVSMISGSVLGVESVAEGNFIDLESLVETDEDIDWATISSELGSVEKIDKDIKSIPSNAQRVALVNTSMLNLLGIDANTAVGEMFQATLIFDSGLFDRTNYIVESEAIDIKIVGVVSDSKTPTFYLPLSDVLVDGMNNVSAVKIVLEDTQDVAGVRTSVESLGFQTKSVVDTVDSISSLFGYVRAGLLVLGLIALGVASLGMFNTLTVSLLEKTREVGLLKTMGLKSDEVKTLFLAESVIMSVMGGVAGLLLGFAIGKLLSLLISIIALSQGQGFIDVTYIPWVLGLSLVLISAVVGIGTGWYPAERAKKVSALNALRYE